MIYREQKSDYLFHSWNAAGFDAQFDLLMDEEACVAITEKGFVRLTLLQKIGEIVKGLLGGIDYSQKNRVEAAWLQFLYYGEAHGFLKVKQIQRLSTRISYSKNFDFDPKMQEVFQKIKKYHSLSDQLRSEHLSSLRKLVTQYHKCHASILRPGLWTRLLSSPALDPKKLIFFGDTPLELCRKSLKQKNPNPSLAFHYLKKAFDIKNDSPHFQEKLAKQLQKLEEVYFSKSTRHHRKIQELWIQLGEIAFDNQLPDLAETYLSRALKQDPNNVKNRIAIGKIYLVNKEYELVQPFLSDLQRSCSQDIQMQIAIGKAYWKTDQFEEAVKTYRLVLKRHDRNGEKYQVQQKDIAFIHSQIGRAHSEELLLKFTLKKGISFLSQAVEQDPTVLKYQKNLCEAYIKQWKIPDVHFANIYGMRWLKFLDKLDMQIAYTYQTQINEILLGCSEQYFKEHKNQKAHLYLEQTLILFKEDVDVKIKGLDLAIRYNDWSPLESQFSNWKSAHHTNPYLTEKMGDAYWNSSNQNKALQTYQESLELFQQFSVSEEEEYQNFQQHMAEIQARIGQTQLQLKPGFFRGPPFDQAIKNLESATQVMPDRFSLTLFDAYLKAAQAEKKRTALLRNPNKVMEYYQKAFEISSQKGEYLIELMQLYLDYKRYDDAVLLYDKIQCQSWSQELLFSPTVLSLLGESFFQREDWQMSIRCFKQAFESEPRNQQYQYDYFKSTLNLAQDQYQNIQNKKKDKGYRQQLLEIIENIETCWQEGFDHVEDLKESFQEILANLHQSLAASYLEDLLLPKLTKDMNTAKLIQYQQEHQIEIQQILHYYDKALHYQPENAALHFDKGLFLDWLVEYESAIQECELAVLYEPYNPFYHKLLASLYYACLIKAEQRENHVKLAEEYGYINFTEDYKTFIDEFISQSKTKQINPHSYTKQPQKGWFS